MDKLNIKYSTTNKAVPPQRIRIKSGGWAGSPEKMVDGSEPQPWHCLPFVEASTYGLELLYQYDTECHVVNDNGDIRFEWDFINEPGGGVTGGEFVTFFPRPSKYYLFNTRVDLVSPPGHVIRTEPHPRFYTDQTGTVPLAIGGHVQSEWWPRKLFVVFKVPPPGQRHIFRKGEPYVQILFVPHRMVYEPVAMTQEEDAERRALEYSITDAASTIAENIWRNPTGYAFNDHYKVLGRAFKSDGMAAVEETVQQATERQQQALPKDKTIPQCLELGAERVREQKYGEAKAIYGHILSRDPKNAEALMQLGIIFASTGLPLSALKRMSEAVALQPGSSTYHANLGEMYRRLGRHAEAEAAFRSSLQIKPNSPGVLSLLGLTVAQQGRAEEGLKACRAAMTLGPPSPVVHYRIGSILAQQRQFVEARASYEAALALDPSFADARRGLQDLMAASAEPEGSR